MAWRCFIVEFSKRVFIAALAHLRRCAGVELLNRAIAPKRPIATIKSRRSVTYVAALVRIHFDVAWFGDVAFQVRRYPLPTTRARLTVREPGFLQRAKFP